MIVGPVVRDPPCYVEVEASSWVTQPLTALAEVIGEQLAESKVLLRGASTRLTCYISRDLRRRGEGSQSGNNLQERGE